jgi:hypothetical protein
MPVLHRCLLAAAAFALAPAAAAQEEAPQPDSPIVVTGTRDLDREVADFVAALTPVAGQGQLARFEATICPAASGFAPAQKLAVIERIRRVAKAAKLGLGGPKCRANLVVLVTQDKKVLIETLARRHPQYLSGLSNSEIKRLARSPGPAAAWHLAGPPRNADGAELISDNGAGVYVNRTTRSQSRITQAVRPQTAAAVVVIESRALAGLTTIQVADYAAMRTLLRADPNALGTSAAPTILKVLDAPMGSEVPMTLTRWDLGMLHAYYDSPLNLRAASQRSAIRKQLGESVTGKSGQN